MANQYTYWAASIKLSSAAQKYCSDAAITLPYEGNLLDLTVFVSCYNEAAFIIDTLNTVVDAMKEINKTYEVIVIDDDSKDKSVELVSNYINEHPEINIILRINSKNKGLAQNYIDAAFLGHGKYFRLICGDNSEPKETLLKVVKMMGEADVIVPHYLSFEGKSAHRQFISKLFTKMINLVSGNKIRYYNGLHMHLRHNIMRWHPNTRGFGFQAALLCMIIEQGFSYKEVACITIERRGGRGNALTWKNLRSVIHVFLGILFRRMTSWV